MQEQDPETFEWHGPPISKQSIEILLETPIWADLPPEDPSDCLGRVAFKAILINRDEGRRFFYGHLCQFFLCNVHVSREYTMTAEQLYSPARFLPGLFYTTCHAKFGLGHDTDFTLWMVFDQCYPCIRIYDNQSMKDALDYLQTDYLRARPLKHHIVTFLVEVDDDKTKSLFTPAYKPIRFSWEPPAPPERVPSPDYQLDVTQRSNESEFSPDRTNPFSEDPPSTATAESVSHYSDNDETVYGAEESDDGAKMPSRPESPTDDADLAPEVEGPRGVLESIDTDVRMGDVVDGDMDSVLPVAGSPSEDDWKSCMSLLGLDPHDHLNPVVRSIPIPNTSIRISPRQYRSAFWMLTCRDRDLPGGILADVPGTGKTHTVLATVLLRSLIAYNMAEVKKEWATREYEAAKAKKAREFRHLAPGAASGELCPCGNDLGIMCYAVSEHVTRRIGDTMSRGPSLILAPQGVIEEWKKVLSTSYINRKYFDPCLIHTMAPRELAPPPNFAKRFKVIGKPRQDDFPRDHELQVTDVEFSYTIDSEQGKQPERYIILTTHQIEQLRKEFQYSLTVSIAGEKKRQTVYGLPVGSLFVDEFHKVRKGVVVELALETTHITRSNTEFWSVTGTPLTSGSLMDLDTTLSILQLPQEHLQTLEKAYRLAVSATGSQDTVETFLKRAQDFFTPLIMHHTMDSQFFGQRISTMEAFRPTKTTFTTPAEHLDSVQALANQVRDRIHSMTGSDNYEQVVRSLDTYKELLPLQVASTFPSAASYLLNGVEFDTQTLRGLIRTAKGDVTAIGAIEGVAEVLASNSPKLDNLVQFFKQMDKDRTSRPGQNANGQEFKKRDDRKMKKMVVITPTLAEAVFLFLGLKQRLPGVGIAFFHADLLASQKQRILKDFQALTPKSPRILVTPYEVGGTGLNLQTANYQVLTGPLRTNEAEKQAFARTNREGNQLALHHRVYLTDDNPADRLIIARRANRRMISDPFDMSAPFEVEGASPGASTDGGDQ
jgi:hypothetical protein